MHLNELYLKQPKARKKKVWDTDEHQGKNRPKWYTARSKDTKPYRWSNTGTFHGQSEGYEDHII